MIVEADGDLNQQDFDVQTNAEVLLLHEGSKKFQAFDLIATIGTTFAAHRDDLVQFLQDCLVCNLFVFAERDELVNLRRT